MFLLLKIQFYTKFIKYMYFKYKFLNKTFFLGILKTIQIAKLYWKDSKANCTHLNIYNAKDKSRDKIWIARLI